MIQITEIAAKAYKLYKAILENIFEIFRKLFLYRITFLAQIGKKWVTIAMKNEKKKIAKDPKKIVNSNFIWI